MVVKFLLRGLLALTSYHRLRLDLKVLMASDWNAIIGRLDHLISLPLCRLNHWHAHARWEQGWTTRIRWQLQLIALIVWIRGAFLRNDYCEVSRLPFLDFIVYLVLSIGWILNNIDLNFLKWLRYTLCFRWIGRYALKLTASESLSVRNEI